MFVHKKVKVCGLPEKVCLIGCDQVYHIVQFALLSFFAKNEIKELFVCIKPKSFYFFIKSALKHGFFGKWKLDAVFPRDIGTQSLKALIIHFQETAYVGRIHQEVFILYNIEQAEPGRH